MPIIKAHFLFVLFFFCSQFSFGQNNVLTYSGCQNLTSDDFSFEYLFNKSTLGGDLYEPVKMDFDMDENGIVDVYFIELREKNGNKNSTDKSTGRLRVYRGASKTVEDLLSIEVSSARNDGLFALALDPNFKQTGWVYLAYQIYKDFGIPSVYENTVFRLSRFTIAGKVVNPASEAIILEIPAVYKKWHTGGGMKFDAYGDLWLGVGDNLYSNTPGHDLFRGATNTASLLAKIIRITPNPVFEGNQVFGPGISYEVPKGNFGEFFANEFATTNPALAIEYQDTSKVRAEIYAMGVRNPYTMTMDPVRRWVTYGDCGPDVGGRTEEHTVFTKPANLGWPYFSAENQEIESSKFYGVGSWSGIDPNNPIVHGTLDENLSVNGNGVMQLPPATPGTYNYNKQCAMTGPLYRYDPELNSNVKMPPHFHQTWFFTDYNQGWIHAMKLDNNAKPILTEEFLDKTLLNVYGHSRFRPLDFQVGPDGAFYGLNYAGNYTTPDNAGIFRVSYTGNCRPTYPEFPKLAKTGCTDPAFAEYDPEVPPEFSNPRACKTTVNIRLESRNFESLTKISLILDKGIQVEVNVPGEYVLELTNSQGKLITSQAGKNSQTVTFKSNFTKGIYFLRLRFENRSLTKKVIIF